MEIYSKLRMPQTHKINEMADFDIIENWNVGAVFTPGFVQVVDVGSER